MSGLNEEYLTKLKAALYKLTALEPLTDTELKHLTTHHPFTRLQINKYCEQIDWDLFTKYQNITEDIHTVYYERIDPKLMAKYNATPPRCRVHDPKINSGVMVVNVFGYPLVKLRLSFKGALTIDNDVYSNPKDLSNNLEFIDRYPYTSDAIIKGVAGLIKQSKQKIIYIRSYSDLSTFFKKNVNISDLTLAQLNTLDRPNIVIHGQVKNTILNAAAMNHNYIDFDNLLYLNAMDRIRTGTVPAPYPVKPITLINTIHDTVNGSHDDTNANEEEKLMTSPLNDKTLKDIETRTAAKSTLFDKESIEDTELVDDISIFLNAAQVSLLTSEFVDAPIHADVEQTKTIDLYHGRTAKIVLTFHEPSLVITDEINELYAELSGLDSSCLSYNEFEMLNKSPLGPGLTLTIFDHEIFKVTDTYRDNIINRVATYLADKKIDLLNENELAMAIGELYNYNDLCLNEDIKEITDSVEPLRHHSRYSHEQRESHRRSYRRSHRR